MRVEVIGRRVEATDRIRAYAEKKGEKFEKYFDRIQQMTWRLDQENASKDIFKVELVVDVERHQDFVAHADGSDIYAVIDAVSDKMSRQLTDYKEKLRLGHR